MDGVSTSLLIRFFAEFNRSSSSKHNTPRLSLKSIKRPAIGLLQDTKRGILLNVFRIQSTPCFVFAATKRRERKDSRYVVWLDGELVALQQENIMGIGKHELILDCRKRLHRYFERGENLPTLHTVFRNQRGELDRNICRRSNRVGLLHKQRLERFIDDFLWLLTLGWLHSLSRFVECCVFQDFIFFFFLNAYVLFWCKVYMKHLWHEESERTCIVHISYK